MDSLRWITLMRLVLQTPLLLPTNVNFWYFLEFFGRINAAPLICSIVKYSFLSFQLRYILPNNSLTFLYVSSLQFFKISRKSVAHLCSTAPIWFLSTLVNSSRVYFYPSVWLLVSKMVGALAENRAAIRPPPPSSGASMFQLWQQTLCSLCLFSNFFYSWLRRFVRGYILKSEAECDKLANIEKRGVGREKEREMNILTLFEGIRIAESSKWITFRLFLHSGPSDDFDGLAAQPF